MIINHFRIDSDQKSTSGYWKIDGSFECFTLEDEHRDVKVKGQTRIPAGTYSIVFRKEDSPLTKKYRDRYDWFTYHLMLKDVPGFQYCYVHTGNVHTHTEGCILVGDSIDNRGDIEDFLGNSRKAFERVYKKISAALNINEPVTISIYDNERDFIPVA